MVGSARGLFETLTVRMVGTMNERMKRAFAGRQPDRLPKSLRPRNQNERVCHDRLDKSKRPGNFSAGGQFGHRRRGIVNIWAVLMFLVIIGFVGLSLDVGFGMLVGFQLQNAADAASLAGVTYVRSSAEEVREAAVLLASENKAAGDAVQLSPNEANASDGDIVIGTFDRETGVFTPTAGSGNAVKVVARRDGSSLGGALPLFFGPIFGVNTVNLERTAIAMIGGGTGAGIITLNETEKWTFRLSGNITLDVFDSTSPDGEGAIQINSNDARALKTDGSPELLASEINVNADTVTDAPVFDGEVNTSQPRMEDPLAGLVAPVDWGVDQGSFSVTGGNHDLAPGYYPDGITMTGGTIILATGIFVLDGVGLKITGGDMLANGVMLYVVDSTPSDPQDSSVTITGNGDIDITPMTLEESIYGEIAIWQDASNDSEATLRGTSSFSGIDGTLYFPSAHVEIVGTSDTFGVRQLISDTLGISGNGTVTINYDGRNPAPGTKGFLVR